jgi:hypothetical protein
VLHAPPGRDVTLTLAAGPPVSGQAPSVGDPSLPGETSPARTASPRTLRVAAGSMLTLDPSHLADPGDGRRSAPGPAVGTTP